MFYYCEGDRSDYYEIAVEWAIVVIAFMIIFTNGCSNRYVEFYDENIRFSFFRIGEARKVMSFNFRYEDITSIESSYLPVIGV